MWLSAKRCGSCACLQSVCLPEQLKVQWARYMDCKKRGVRVWSLRLCRDSCHGDGLLLVSFAGADAAVAFWDWRGRVFRAHIKEWFCKGHLVSKVFSLRISKCACSLEFGEDVGSYLCATDTERECVRLSLCVCVCLPVFVSEWGVFQFVLISHVMLFLFSCGSRWSRLKLWRRGRRRGTRPLFPQKRNPWRGRKRVSGTVCYSRTINFSCFTWINPTNIRPTLLNQSGSLPTWSNS